MPSKSSLKASFLLLMLGFTWGSGYSLAKYAMTNNVPPLGYAFWQSLGPALLLSLICIVTKQHKAIFSKNWGYFFICGLIGISIPNSNMYFISSHIPAGLLAVLVNTVPLIVYPLALFSKLEKLDLWRVGALFIGMIGVFLIIGPSNYSLFSYWSFLALISPLSFALCSIYIAKYQPKNLNILQSASGMLIAATLLLTPLVIQQNAFYPLSFPITLVKEVIGLEIILSSLGYVLFFLLIQTAGPVFYSLTGGIVALTGLFWGYIIFSEKPTSLQLIAIACVITGIFLLSWRQSKQGE